MEISEISENHFKAIVDWRQVEEVIGVGRVLKCRQENRAANKKCGKMGLVALVAGECCLGALLSSADLTASLRHLRPRIAAASIHDIGLSS